MTTITIVPDNPGSPQTAFRAFTASKQSVGPTAGQALDALAAQLSPEEGGTLLVVQHMKPDVHFPADKRLRLEHLMNKWPTARAGNDAWSAEDQQELEALVDAELQAATERAVSLTRQLAP